MKARIALLAAALVLAGAVVAACTDGGRDRARQEPAGPAGPSNDGGYLGGGGGRGDTIPKQEGTTSQQP